MTLAQPGPYFNFFTTELNDRPATDPALASKKVLLCRRNCFNSQQRKLYATPPPLTIQPILLESKVFFFKSQNRCIHATSYYHYSVPFCLCSNFFSLFLNIRLSSSCHPLGALVHRLDVHGRLFGRALRSNRRNNWDPVRNLAISKKGLYVHVAVRPPL